MNGRTAIMNIRITHAIVPLLIFALTAHAQRNGAEPAQDNARSFAQASADAERRLQASLEKLAELRERISAEKIPLSRKLNELERELMDVRQQYQETTRLLDSRTLDLSNLRNEIESREEEAAYLSNLLSEYIRNFESRLHIAELQRYEDALEAAKLAPENSHLSDRKIYETQASLVATSLARLHDIVGGTRFEGTAVDEGGIVRPGTFAMIGPAALFQSDDGAHVGTVEQRLGSLEPAVVAFELPEHAQSAAQVVDGTGGRFPFDPTLGNAHVIATTKDSLWEHVQKGGPVMIPIFALAAAAFLVALYKWIALTLVRKPSKKQIRGLLDALRMHDKEAAKKNAHAIKGPAGKMLTTGMEHLGEPRDLIEEVMYEKVLEARLKLQRFLPFIAVSASAAPLLGLLGTVTGIINTFKLITVFGTGDVKTLSGGISEALVTTEFGLIVAIPSLLLYAFLSRKARGIIDEMEKAAVSFSNTVSKTKYGRMASEMKIEGLELPAEPTEDHAPESGGAQSGATAEQLRGLLVDLLSPAVNDQSREQPAGAETAHNQREHNNSTSAQQEVGAGRDES